MTMAPPFRVYHAALLDYVLGGDEPSLTHAYEIGRSGFKSGCGLLDIVHVHENALSVILESTPVGDEFRRRIQVAAKFLAEALSPFEMACHGYRAVLENYQSQR